MATNTTPGNLNTSNVPPQGGGRIAPGDDVPQRRRLFRRFQSASAATASPFPRPRDEHGDTRARKYTYDGTIPEKGTLLSQHGRSLELIARYRPLRAAMLRDIIQRVDAATDRHGAVVHEEEQALQLFNEDAANAQAVVQDQINTLNEAKAARERLEDHKCEECRRELAESRSEYAAQRAQAGLPVPLIELRGTTLTDDMAQAEGPEGIDAARAGGEATVDGAVGIADAQASVISGTAGTVQGHEGGNILTRLFRQGIPGAVMAPTVDPISATARNAGTVFPIEVARQQAKPASVHAHESGYPASSAAARIASSHWLPNFLALLTCGAIFGSSIGLLLGFIDPDAMQVAAAKQIGVWAICSFFGVALFYVLGCTAESIFALISEQYHAALVATYRNEPSSVGQWLRRSATWTAAVGTAIFVGLIGIEAVVERYGIVQLAISRMSDAILMGHASAPKADLQGLAACMIALIASVPFMCFHAVRGWTHARLGVLQEAMEAGHLQEVWGIASRNYAEGQERRRVTDTPPVLDEGPPNNDTEALLPPRSLRYSSAPHATGNGTRPDQPRGESFPIGRGQDAEAGDEMMSTTEAATAVLPAIDGSIATPAREGAGAPSEGLTLLTKTADLAALNKSFDPARAETLARANERLREAYIRLREAYRGRRDALQPFDTQIGQLQAMIVQERMELSLDAKRRIEDTYSDVVGAVQAFDRMYQDELKVIERLMRGGLFVRMRDWLFRPAA